MFWLLLVFVAVSLVGVKVSTSGTADYLSIPHTQAIKGFFILVVFFSHFNSYMTLETAWDERYIRIFWFIGQAMVTMFMFYSGYGVMESIKRKGAAYVRCIPQKRVLSTLFKFDCAVLLYVILAFAVGTKLTAGQILLSLIGWDSVGNSNWYIFVILVLYLLTYLAFRVFPSKNHWCSVILFSIVLGVVIGVTRRYGLRPSYWYDTALCYAFGMVYSLAKPRIERIVNRHILIWFAALLGCAVLFVLCRRHGLWDLVANVFFSAAVVLFTMRVTVCNRALIWCGEHLFEVYILQRIPMIVFKKIGFFNPLTFLFSLAITVGLTFVFGRLTDTAWKKIAKQAS